MRSIARKLLASPSNSTPASRPALVQSATTLDPIRHARPATKPGRSGQPRWLRPRRCCRSRAPHRSEQQAEFAARQHRDPAAGLQRIDVALADRSRQLARHAERRTIDVALAVLARRRVRARSQPLAVVPGRTQRRLSGAAAVRPGNGAGANQPQQIERSSGLRPGARLFASAKRLDADDGADDIAIDVNVAGADSRGDARDRLVDAGVQSERQSIAGGVDVLDDAVEVVAPVTQHMQHRTEHLALDVGDPADLDQGGGNEGAELSRRGQRRAA